MPAVSNVSNIDPSQHSTSIEKYIELLSDALIADNIRARNSGIPKQVLIAQMVAAEQETMQLFQKRYLSKIADRGKSPIYVAIKIIFKMDATYNRVKKDLDAAIEQAAKLNKIRSQLYLAKTDSTFNIWIDRLSKQPIEGDCCIKQPLKEIMKELMRKYDII